MSQNINANMLKGLESTIISTVNSTKLPQGPDNGGDTGMDDVLGLIKESSGKLTEQIIQTVRGTSTLGVA